MIDGSKSEPPFCVRSWLKTIEKKIVCRKVLLEKNCLHRCIDKKKFAERYFSFPPPPPPPPPVQKNNGPSLIAFNQMSEVTRDYNFRTDFIFGFFDVKNKLASLTEVILDTILFHISPRDVLAKPLAAARACATQDSANCSKNRKIVPYHASIMAPAHIQYIEIETNWYDL